MAAAPSAPSAAPAPWRLVAPDWHLLDTVRRHPLPFILWPVGNQPLLAHWMDEAIRRGATRVELYVADRPAEVRAWLEDGAYWSREVQVIPLPRAEDAPAAAEHLGTLPGDPAPAVPPQNGAELLDYWFQLQTRWLTTRTAVAAELEEERTEGGWIGPRAQIHPQAKLIAPYWIGDRVRIGPHCQVGPFAFVGCESVVEEGAEIEHAVVTAHTFVGAHTRVAYAIAEGGTLVDLRRQERIEIQEPFILAALRPASSQTSLLARASALALYTLLAPLALLYGRTGWRRQEVKTCEGEVITLHTGQRGPLWARRWPWLRHVAAGRLCWIGALPREEQEWERIPSELAAQVRAARAGVFSLADVHGCHETTDPEEWMHASFQAQQAAPGIRKTVLRHLWSIAWQRGAADPTSA